MRTIAPKELNLDRVFPRNVVGRSTNRRGELSALRRTWRVVAADDRLDELRIEPRGCYHLVNAEAGLFHVAGQRFHYNRILSPRAAADLVAYLFFPITMNRRTFLASSSAALLPAAAAGPPKRIAAVLTEYWLGSHSDVVIGKYLEGYNQDDKPPYPRSKIVAMFTEHVPKNDMSRPMAKKYGVPIFRTVQEALTLGGDKLAVDGVILVGEHGEYPVNDKGQTLYPRFEMFLKITDVFRQSGRSVPVFNDKHLSFNCPQARRMVADLEGTTEFPMLAGSSVPVAYRVPAIDTPFGAAQKYAVAISYSGLDIYGFHVLEALECMVDRRKGGETGVRSVQCLEKQDCWNFIEGNGWVKRLFDEALTHSKTRKPGAPKDLVKDPAVFVVEYNDGLQGAAFLMTGMVEDSRSTLMSKGKAQAHLNPVLSCRTAAPSPLWLSRQEYRDHVRNRQGALSSGANHAHQRDP